MSNFSEPSKAQADLSVKILIDEAVKSCKRDYGSKSISEVRILAAAYLQRALDMVSDVKNYRWYKARNGEIRFDRIAPIEVSDAEDNRAEAEYQAARRAKRANREDGLQEAEIAEFDPEKGFSN